MVPFGAVLFGCLESVGKVEKNEVFIFIFFTMKLSMLKCLVILDNVWRREDWECLRLAFPLENEGSKIVY